MTLTDKQVIARAAACKAGNLCFITLKRVTQSATRINHSVAGLVWVN